jgi:ankyrin repeat protein
MNNTYGYSLLMIIEAAAYRGEVENVELLLDHGASLNTAPIGIYGNELQGAFLYLNHELFLTYR